MKKFFLSALVAVVSFGANAQPSKGDVQTSIDFTPFASSGEMFSNTGINLNYFLTDKDAIRVGLNYNNKSNKDKDSNSTWKISLGYENHFKSYNKIDLFAGAQISFGGNTEKLTESDGEKTYDLKQLGSGTTLGVQAFTGINVYVYKQLYIGAEIQLGYNHTNLSKYEMLDYDDKGNTVVKEVDPKSSSNEIGFKINSCLRLGWTF